MRHTQTSAQASTPAVRIPKVCDVQAMVKEQARMVRITGGLADMKQTLREIIPASFAWWLVIDSEINVKVTWQWNGEPGVEHLDEVEDYDFQIVADLLRRMDWKAEVRKAIESIGGFRRIVAMTDAERAEKKRVAELCNRHAADADVISIESPQSLRGE